MKYASRAVGGFWPAFVLVLVLGVYLRAQQIGIQWLTDDEWHAVHKLASSSGYRPILLSFGAADYSIPLTILYKFLSLNGGLTELKMRLPMLVGGVLLLGLATAWVRARIGGGTAVVYGFLLAISPVLVNFSRYARPYIVTLLLAALAVWALARWERDGRARHAAGYIACACIGSYLHLITAPFFIGLLLPLYVRRLRLRQWQQWWPLLAVTVLAAAGILALALPPLLADFAAMGSKTGSDIPRFDTLAGAWHLWFGTDSVAVALAGVALAALGAATVWRRMPVEFASWLSGCGGILAAIVVLKPAYVQYPLILARYLLPAVPLLLLLVAAGIVHLARRLPSRPLQLGAGAAISVLFLAGTPHLSLLRHPNNFTLHSYYHFDYRKRHNPVRQALAPFADPSPFWRQLALLPKGSQRIAVAGQTSFETLFVFHPLYQPVHRQRMFSLQTRGICAPARPGEAYPSEGVALRNAVSLESEQDLRAKGIDWIVIESRYSAPYAPVSAEVHREYIDGCNRRLAERYGPPAYEDDHLKAYRIRGAAV